MGRYNAHVYKITKTRHLHSPSIVSPQALTFPPSFKLYLCFEYLEYLRPICLLLD